MITLSLLAKSIQIQGSESALDFPGGSVTVSAWVRLSSSAHTPTPTIAAKGSGFSNWNLGLEASTNRVTFAAGTAPLTGGESIAGPFWRHLVGVAEAGVATRLYIDGLLVAVGGPPALGSSGLPMEIGGNPEVFDQNWNGLIDEVSVWNRPLDPGEIRQLWNAGRGATMTDLVVGTDTDGDGMDDVYETAHGLDPNVPDADADKDGDGLSNGEEFEAGSDPSKPDTDGDGLNDGGEATAGTNPLDPDSDGDGLTDGEEVSGSRNPFLNGIFRESFDPGTDPPGDPTDPLAADTDGDSWVDPVEMTCKTDPNDGDDFCPFPVPVAYWDFNEPFETSAPEVPVTSTSSSSPEKLRLTLRNNASQTPDAGGHTGEAGDRGIDFGTHNDGSNAKTALGDHFLGPVNGVGG